MSHEPDDYALVIGIDHYPRWSDGANSLLGSRRDAADFHGWLVSDDGGGIPPAQARLILSTNEPAAPLQQRIDDELAGLKDASTGKRRRRFYLYFAGHGHSPALSAGGQALCLANFSMESQRAALDLGSYRNTIVGCMRFEQSLFFLDCCRVRQFVPPGKACELECADPRLEGRQAAILYGSDHYAESLEDEIEDELEDETAGVVRGFFTAAMLKILGEGPIELADLKKRLTIDVPLLADPRPQKFRMIDDTFEPIILGPRTGRQRPPAPRPPQPDGPTTPLFRFGASFDTRVSPGAQLPGEPPAPPAGTLMLMKGDRVVASGQGELSTKVPGGRYRLVSVHGERVTSEPVRIAGDLSVIVPMPRRGSAAPLSGTTASHEWITQPSVAASRGGAGRQGVFVAHWSRDLRKPVPVPGWLHLQGSDGERIDFGSGLVRKEVAKGQALLYHWHDRDASPVILPVPVAPGWDTQVFLVHEGGRPRLDVASVLMRPAGLGFDPTDALLDAYERALADLVTDGPGPDRGTLENLLYGKWRNPLFGLIGAHFLARAIRRDEDRPPDDRPLLDTVIANLTKLLGAASPDLLALRVIRSELFEDAPRVSMEEAREKAQRPPLLRASLDTLIAASATDPRLLDEQYDGIALGLASESPWCCWDSGVLNALHATADERLKAFSPTLLRERHRNVPPWLVEVAEDELRAARRQRRRADAARMVHLARQPYRLCRAAMDLAAYGREAAQYAEAIATPAGIGA